MKIIDDIVDCFSRLPGIGKKSASRIAYHLLNCPPEEAKRLADILYILHEKVRHCTVCGAFSEREVCEVCTDDTRDRSIICVVEQPQDVNTLYSIPEYHGLFHVLGGVIAPLYGVGPDKLSIGSLLKRIKKENIQEIILATNPTLEGDTTALYIQNLLREDSIKITRLASGLPVGGDLEYADRLTLSRSFKGRTSF